MNSHIDDIIGLIDNILGPDTGGPVPTHAQMQNIRPASAVIRPRQPIMGRTRNTGGKYRVNQLDDLTLAKLESHLGARSERGLSNNTKVSRDYDGNLIIVLHQTAIVTYKRDIGGEVTMTLNSGGWQTTTTKQRMNAFLPHRYQVFADKGSWYIRVRSAAGDDIIDYHDGINLYTGER